MKQSRRHFIGGSCAVLASACTSQHSTTRQAPVTAQLQYVKKIKEEPSLQLLPYRQVQLEKGLLLEQFEQQIQLYQNMDDDALLKPFRQRAGMPAPGVDMGGWYDDSDDFHIDPNDWSTANWHGYIPGHSFGQYLSALAKAYAISGEPRYKQKIHALWDDYAKTISADFFVGYALPCYTYDKLVIGLVDAYRYTAYKNAASILDKLTDAALPYFPEKSWTREERRKLPHTQEADIWDEPYTLPENLFIAWQLGMGERYKELGLRYMQNEKFFDPLARGECPFAGRHAYSHINALSSAIQAWHVTGEERYLAAAKNGFDFLQAQSYATGGWGPNEELVAADDSETLYKMLSDTHRSFETPCSVYAHFKITRSLLQITKDSRYGDSMETILYNTILGAWPTQENGDTFYYSDYHYDAQKFYRGEAWPCCSGTFAQVVGDYSISAYLSAPQQLYVNLYIPSKANLEINGVAIQLTQTTDYPFRNQTRLKIETTQATQFILSLRIPAWAGKQSQININGESIPAHSHAGTFMNINRTWKNGDEIELIFDMPLRLQALNEQYKNVVALLHGPLVLMPLVSENLGAQPLQLTEKELMKAKQESTTQWRVEAHTETGNKQITFKPFVAIKDERYSLYMRLKI